MSQDIVADALNQIMNALRAEKSFVNLRRHSKFLLSVLAIGKLRGYIRDYKSGKDGVLVEFGDKLNFCRAVKPRYLVKSKDIEKYTRRYLPSRNLGVVIISTSKGLMTHHTAQENKIGGSIIAYFY